MTRKSESYNEYSRDWEDIVTCSIHLGIMEDPRKLSCQHCFCYKCLKEYSRNCAAFICPICRAEEKITDIDQLQSALTEKQVIDVLMKHKLHVNMTGSDPSSETYTKLGATDSAELNQVIFSIPDENEDCFENSSDCSKSVLRKSDGDLNIGSACSSIYDMMDIDMMRETMLKHSHYKVIKKGTVQRCYKYLYQYEIENIPFNFSLFDTFISGNPKNPNQFALVNTNNSEMVIFSESHLQTFHIFIEGSLIRPEYIRFFQGNMILSGSFEKDGKSSSVFLQCNLKGEILHQSQFYPWPDSCSAPVMLGFDMDCKGGNLYLCMPHYRKLLVYDNKMSQSSEVAEFNDNQPEYVAVHSLQNQLFISCPFNKKIIILDIEFGTYRLINTEKLKNAIPKTIFVTDDEKIIFLDTNRNKLVWIKRRNEYILVQNLKFPSIYRDCAIKTFQVMPCSTIIVVFQKEILIFQSVKCISKSRRFLDLCNTL